MKRRRAGQAIVEFALVSPVFILLLFGAIEFGRAYLDMHLLTNAAREGARAGILPGKTEQDVYDAVDLVLTGAGMEAGSWQTAVVVTDSEGSVRTEGLSASQEGDKVEVTVTYGFEVLVGSLIPGWSGTIGLHSTCVFRHE